MKKKNKKSEQESKCRTCYGYGLWAIGYPSPMGSMDYADGCPNKKCPECGRGGEDRNV